MSAVPDLTIILSTHDRPDALSLALEGIRSAAGGAGSLEVVVADDGSGPGTAALVKRFAGSAPFPVGHVRQDHRGFRLAASRNGAVRAARGEVLVFVDGDCILKPGALGLHRARCRPGRAHTGARVFLGEDETTAVLEGSTAGRRPPAGRWEPILRDAERRERWRLLRLRLANVLYRLGRWKPRPKLAAANCAVHRADLAAVNGFDERFVGWGYEDDDLARRLRRRGVKVIDGTMDCLAFHLFHPVHPSHRPRSRGTANYRYFHQGRFLTRPRRGLEPRALESLRFEVEGDPPPSLRPLLEELGTAARADPGRPEVSLRFFPTPARRRPRGEVTISLPPEVISRGPAAVRAYLEDEL